MENLIYWAQTVIDCFTNIGHGFLNVSANIPGYGQLSLAWIVLGGGLLGVLIFRAVKFFTDIIL